MRRDMAKVLTESPRRGHANPSKKWGHRLRVEEYDADDHGSGRVSTARMRQYGWQCKDFTDVLGPLRRYLRKQVGRPWNAVWSEIARTVDGRSLAGQHFFTHVRWEVEVHTWIGADRRVYYRPWHGDARVVEGLFVHPVTGVLAYAPERRRRCDGHERAVERALLAFGIHATTPDEMQRFRIDGTRVWEHRAGLWFIHTYRDVPATVARVLVRYDGSEAPIYAPAHRVRVMTKQASGKEMRDARRLLEAPVVPASPAPPARRA